MTDWGRIVGVACLVGVALFFLLGILALALRLTFVEVVIFFGTGVPFLVIFLYGWFVRTDEDE